MLMYLYDVTDTRTGETFRDLPAVRFFELIGQKTNLLAGVRNGMTVHVIIGAYDITAHREDVGDDKCMNLWSTYPYWSLRFCNEWRSMQHMFGVV